VDLGSLLAVLTPILGLVGLLARVIIRAWRDVKITSLALDGTDPKDRPTILKGVAEVFRASSWWSRGRS
jgi:hypothetical protein